MGVTTGFSINDSGRTAQQATAGREAQNVLSAVGRIELKWAAGERGKPSLNAVIALDENSNAAAHLAANIADRNMEALGTNMTTALSTFHAEGGIKLTTAGADLDQAFVTPHKDANQTPWTAYTWGTDREVVWEGIMSTGSSIAQVQYAGGLKLTETAVITTDADGVFFSSTDGGNWKLCYSIGNVDYTIDSGVAPAANTLYVFRIEIDVNRKAKGYLNGGLVGETAALTDATDLIPMLGCGANGVAAAKHCYVYGMSISRAIGTP